MPSEAQNARSRVADAKLRAMLRRSEPGQTHSQSEIADAVGLSRQRISQIESDALRKLRNLGAGQRLLSELLLELREK